MCRILNAKNIYRVTVEDIEGDEIFYSLMEADDVSKIKTYIKDNFSLSGRFYYINTIGSCEDEIAGGLISDI